MRKWCKFRYYELLMEAVSNDDGMIDNVIDMMAKEGFDPNDEEEMSCTTIGIINYDDSRRKAECVYFNDEDKKWYYFNEYNYTYSEVDLSALPVHTICTIDRWEVKDI